MKEWTSGTQSLLFILPLLVILLHTHSIASYDNKHKYNYNN